MGLSGVSLQSISVGLRAGSSPELAQCLQCIVNSWHVHPYPNSPFLSLPGELLKTILELGLAVGFYLGSVSAWGWWAQLHSHIAEGNVALSACLSHPSQSHH